MLKNDLYTIRDWHSDGHTAKASLLLRPEHPVFQGHFPGQPVVPGACMLQMIKEMMEMLLSTPLQLIHSPAIKFLSPVIPAECPSLQAELSWQMQEEGSLRVTATLLKETIPCFRFVGSFRPMA
jgi:3-hydroxyacyl-[acyl-carrier-protein] dehydratase